MDDEGCREHIPFPFCVGVASEGPQPSEGAARITAKPELQVRIRPAGLAAASATSAKSRFVARHGSPD
jgi:hypothetical protein